MVNYHNIHIRKGEYISIQHRKLSRIYDCVEIIKNCGGATPTRVQHILGYKYKKKLEYRDVHSYILEAWGYRYLKLYPLANKQFAEKSIEKNKHIKYSIRLYKITKKGRDFLNKASKTFRGDWYVI